MTFNRKNFTFKHPLVSTRYDFKPCALVLEEVKVLMMKALVEAKEASIKEKRLNNIDEFDVSKVNNWIPPKVVVWC